MKKNRSTLSISRVLLIIMAFGWILQANVITMAKDETRTVHGYVWPMTVDDLGLGDPFLRLHDIVVELRTGYNTAATTELSTIAVLVPNSTTAGLGEFTIEDVPFGDYVLAIKRPGYLVRCMNITISDSDPDIIELAPPPTDPTDNGRFRLWWGDVDDNLVIDTDDIALVVEHINLSVHVFSALYNPAYDLDASGRIDTADTALIITNLDKHALMYAGAEDVDFLVCKSLELTVSQGVDYRIPLSARNMPSFSGKTVTITYDPLVLQLKNAAEQVYGAHTSLGAIPGTGITITSISPGSIALTFDASIPQGKAWSGVITVLKFEALTAGVTTISVG